MQRLLYAHRGAAAERPENTLPSFALALELGANALETDVHLTRDGAVVVSHDATGARMAGVRRAIADCDLSEVKGWDAGWGFVDASGARPFAGKGFRVPTLEELLVELPAVPLNVDAKATSPAMIPALMEVVRRHRAEDRVRIASFSARNLRRAVRAGYRGAIGLATLEVAALAFLPEIAARRLGFAGRAAQLPPRAGPLHFDEPDFIARLHRLGLRVDFWTVNSAAEARRLWESGADGVMTDDPRAVAPALRELAG